MSSSNFSQETLALMFTESEAVVFFNSTKPKKKGCDTFLLSLWIQTSFSIANIFLLFPLFTFILAVGLQRWRRRDSAPASHSDFFTYHMVMMEMIQVLSCFCYFLSVCLDLPDMYLYSSDVNTITASVKLEFHLLTCVELYLAVVHPIMYIQHKSSRGVTIRNISIGCVWLMWAFWAGLYFSFITYEESVIMYFSHMGVVLTVVCFSCLSVLWALKRPGPADAAGDSEQPDPSKLRAFHVILTIMVVLLLSLGGVSICTALDAALELKGNSGCVSAKCADWVSLPSSLVLPVLFLQRAGKKETK